ncbi:MAG TPA: hypothetical protein VMX55_09815 [candidate division Zixibacteria bacterium]|nr:hypothetical protein [candidate division Zixibacteria bacterium]
MAKKINMIRPKNYVPFIEKANRSFNEVKGFVPVGFSQYRVTRANIPYIEDIQAFANEILSKLSVGYKTVFDMEESKVVILSNDKHPLRIKNL